MHHEQNQNSNIVYKLTALWALSESGIGGFMFAFKIPLTGLLLGAIAIILVSLIAFYSTHVFSEIIKATVLVLMVKIMVSPHSSPTAYLAVAFQGLLAAVLFSNIKSFKAAAILLGSLSMLESAIQKLLLLTIVFGNAFWQAIDIFFEHISKELSINVAVDYSFWLITIYLSFFAIWGFVVGRFASALPRMLSERKEMVMSQYYVEDSNDIQQIPVAVKTKFSLLFMFTFVLLLLFFVAFSFYFPHRAWWMLGRTIIVLLLFYFILLPVTRWVAQRWLQNRNSADFKNAKQLLSYFPQIKRYTSIAYSMAAKESSYIKRIKAFIIYVIIINVYEEEQREHHNI